MSTNYLHTSLQRSSTVFWVQTIYIQAYKEVILCETFTSPSSTTETAQSNKASGLGSSLSVKLDSSSHLALLYITVEVSFYAYPHRIWQRQVGQARCTWWRTRMHCCHCTTHMTGWVEAYTALLCELNSLMRALNLLLHLVTVHWVGVIKWVSYSHLTHFKGRDTWGQLVRGNGRTCR